MEEAFASLEISPPPPCSYDETDFAKFEAAVEKLDALCTRLESYQDYPCRISGTVNRTYFPGRDCYRFKTRKQCRYTMTLCYPQALAYFNNKHNTDYKYEDYVELTLSGMDHNYAVHCNFIAKPQSAPFKPGDFSTKTFFAELMAIHGARLSLTWCCLLDGAETDCKSGCSMCPEGVISHPTAFLCGYKLPLE